MVFRGVRGAFSRFFAADGLFLSAGLAFFFMICMIPLTLLGVSIVGFVLSSEQAADAVVGQLSRNFPVYRRDLARVLLRIVETRRLTGVVGGVVLVFFSTPLFSASRLVMHRLMGVHATRGFVRNFVGDAVRVLLLCLLLFAGTVVTWVYEWLQLVVLPPVGVPSSWRNPAAVLTSILVSTIIFYVGYRYVPLRRVRVGAALGGAVVAAALWQVAKELFRLYIRNVGLYDQIYGPLGVLIAFVMFVYYTAVVFVFGAAYAAAIDSRRA